MTGLFQSARQTSLAPWLYIFAALVTLVEKHCGRGKTQHTWLNSYLLDRNVATVAFTTFIHMVNTLQQFHYIITTRSCFEKDSQRFNAMQKRINTNALKINKQHSCSARTPQHWGSGGMRMIFGIFSLSMEAQVTNVIDGSGGGGRLMKPLDAVL